MAKKMTGQTDHTPEQSEFHDEKRRTYERFTSRFPIKFKDTRCDFGTDVILRNLSAGGARVTVRDRLYLSDSISLEVELLDDKGPMTLRGEVVWANEKDPNLWDVGLKFHKVIFMDMWRVYEAVENNSAG